MFIRTASFFILKIDNDVLSLRCRSAESCFRSSDVLLLFLNRDYQFKVIVKFSLLNFLHLDGLVYKLQYK